jgi:hypothetical protein
MDVCVMMEEFSNRGQCKFNLIIASTRHDADSGGKFVIDPVVQFIQKQSFLNGPKPGGRFRHHDPLLIYVTTRTVQGACD